MANSTRVWGRADSSYRPSVLATGALTIGLVAVWSVLFSVSILGALWRLQEPNAPAPVLSTADQRADLVVLAVQLAVGLLAVAVVSLVRRRSLVRVLPERRGSAGQAAVAFCTALAGSSACALVLDRVGVLRFDLSTPAVVESPVLAVISALSAGLREEPLLAALPVLLLIGRIPIGWIMVVAGAMRGVLYLYFGGGGFVWAALWGAAAVWVYYKYRRLVVLVIVHGFVMNLQAVDRLVTFDSAAMLLQWANILILFGALTLWLVPRALGNMHAVDVGIQGRPSGRQSVSDAAADAELPLVPPPDATPSTRPPVGSP